MDQTVTPPPAAAIGYSAFPLVQTAWVVDDLDQAMKSWLALGIGPFFRFDLEVPDALYRGRRVPLAFSIALAQAGPCQLELIRQNSEGPSAYRDGVPAGQSGFHHVCRAFGGFDEGMRSLGVTVDGAATYMEIAGSRTAYVDMRATHGCMIELVDRTPVSDLLSKTVAEAAGGWDGSDPIRAFAL
ncbi:VOC family protein [Croceicoccus mobilis]|uniref:Glyoxalase n=1 Tax=Croceicoccus mobilis TaxID=1703339 RepID=A0A916Z824_9SPHN|nr:VOC family protein [Croceicoccus mobilis]GGD80513.1 glyoxalase [Croceicoccus mobilis]